MTLHLQRHTAYGLCACITVMFVISAGINAWSTTAKPIMPYALRGIHITYNKTTHAFALPKEAVDSMVRAFQGSGDPDVVKQFVKGAKSRAASHTSSDQAEYWGTMHRFVYTEKVNNYAAVYDGTKLTFGSASAIIPGSPKQSVNPKQNLLCIMKDADRVDISIPSLGIHQPGKSIFDPKVVLSKTTPLPSGEERIYRIPGQKLAHVLQYDKSGHITTLTTYPHYDTSLISERYTYSDYASVGGTPYPREVICEKMRWLLGSNHKLTNFPDTKTIYRATKATAEPLPKSYYTLTSIPQNTRIHDARYRNPHTDAPMITYNYSNIHDSIDAAAKTAYQNLLTSKKPSQHKQQQSLSITQYVCIIAILIVSVGAFVIYKKRQP